MSNRDHEVYSKAVRRKLDALEAKKHALELKVRAVARQIEELIVGQSAIFVGARITWTNGTRERYGRVVSISSAYRGFEYRVIVTTKQGRDIGTATVSEHHHPELIAGQHQ